VYLQKICPSATLFTTNLTRRLGVEPGPPQCETGKSRLFAVALIHEWKCGLLKVRAAHMSHWMCICDTSVLPTNVTKFENPSSSERAHKSSLLGWNRVRPPPFLKGDRRAEELCAGIQTEVHLMRCWIFLPGNLIFPCLSLYLRWISSNAVCLSSIAALFFRLSISVSYYRFTRRTKQVNLTKWSVAKCLHYIGVLWFCLVLGYWSHVPKASSKFITDISKRHTWIEVYVYLQ
jgi:hypothetical protein